MSMIKIIRKETIDDMKIVDKLRADYKADDSEETIAEFEAACENFRAACKQIGDALGVEDFKGGFEEIIAFQESDVAKTAAGLMLAMKWAAADKLCTYIADRKLKIGQPAWWKRCWGIED